MRLAPGQIRRVLADRSHDSGHAAAGQGSREIQAGHAGDDEDGQARHRALEAGLRATLRSRYCLLDARSTRANAGPVAESPAPRSNSISSRIREVLEAGVLAQER